MNDQDANRGRDVTILKGMGIFFLFFGCLLLAALFWEQDTPARVVSLGAALALLGTGTGCLLASKMLRKRGSK